VNAVEVAGILEDCGMSAIAVHGRTRSQGYGGAANWEVIDAVARAVSIPVIGNGDITCGADVMRRKQQTAVSGVMIGRAAMQNPWVFREAKHFLESGMESPEILLEERWELVVRHCALAVGSSRYGDEKQTLTAMRSRLMAYCKGFPGAKELRQRLCHVGSVAEVEDLAAFSLSRMELGDNAIHSGAP
jgi:tRNA-dihydrouridine synthase B